METQTGTGVVSSTVKGIDVSKIEQELSALWKRTTGSLKAEDAGSGVTRACVLNLLVYATAHEERAEIEKILGEVFEQNPCRALILVADETAGDAGLAAHVSSHNCELEQGVKQICGEEVTIEAKGAAINSVASALAPLLVPDVPVFLWWKDIPHYENKLFDRMTALADRLVIDSCSFDHPHDDLKRLAQLIEERPDFVRVSDLNWGRLTAWRTLLASFWDVPDYKPLLNEIDRVTIEYDPPEISREDLAANALLIAGWLASRLSWTINADGFTQDTDTKRFALRGGDGRAVKVEIRACADKKETDGLLACVTLANDQARAQFYVGLSADGKRLQTEANIGDERTVGRIVTYEARSEGKRLSRELSFLAHDTIYEAAVSTAAQLIASIKQ